MATIPSAEYAAARTAADRIVGAIADPSVVRATAALWIAENGWSWPPRRNNPGNNASSYAIDLGLYPYCVPDLPTNPQKANPIVTYADTDTGVLAFADGIARFPRYATAVQKAVAWDGPGYGEAIIAAGFGTRLDTFQQVYGMLPDPPAVYRTTDQGVNLRKSPALTGALVEAMPKGAKCAVLHTKLDGGAYTANSVSRTDWYYVTSPKGNTGWAVAGHLV